MPRTTPELLARLGRLNPTSVFLGTAALILGALLLPGPYGGVLLLLLAAVLAGFVVLTWRHGEARARGVRVLVLALLLLLAALKLASAT